MLAILLIIAGIYALGFAVLRAAKPTEDDIQIELEREREWWMGSL